MVQGISSNKTFSKNITEALWNLRTYALTVSLRLYQMIVSMSIMRIFELCFIVRNN